MKSEQVTTTKPKMPSMLNSNKRQLIQLLLWHLTNIFVAVLVLDAVKGREK